MKNKNKKVRLSKDIVPLKYDLRIHPDLENFTFSGTETITADIKKPTKKIVLHSKEIDIETAKVSFNKKDLFPEISYDQKSETVEFAFTTEIQPGKIKLTLVFQGILNDKMRGFYRSSYVYGGKVHHLATTQFEATDARRAFPCFDEPTHKAVFNVSLVVPQGMTAISNTLPTTRTLHESGFEVVKFPPTPKMSTYLLAFLVGNFEYIETKSQRGVLVRVYTTPGKTHQAQFALETTVRVLEFYENYFGIPYPLNTLDMIAIPDFAAGAMENWGAITYRESALLVDSQDSSTSNKQWVALVIAHELAHQWFGNLVTMEWWTHLWLNEGFASYIEYLAVDHLFPKWEIWTQFVNHDMGIALKLDSLENTHPIEIKVHHPDEIGEIFDAVSYSKGASVIRMLANYLGEKDFRDGLRYYLKKHSYKNTETIHLWEAFEKTSKKPVTEIMKNWTSKGGYPIVSVDLKKNNRITYQQKRYFSSQAKKDSGDNTTWQIPISLKTPNQEPMKFLLGKKKFEGEFDKDVIKWIKVNYGENSFHRTAYDRTLLEMLGEPVQDKVLPPADRLGIIRDLFALSEAGIIPTTDTLEFLEVYKEEDNYTVWVEIASGMAHLEQLLAKTKAKDSLNAFTIDLFQDIYKKIGWESIKDESHANALLRPMVISRLGNAGHEPVVKEITKKWNHLKKGDHVNPDLRSSIYNTMAMLGSLSTHQELTKRYIKSELHEEKNRIGNALGKFKDKNLLEKTLAFALSKEVRFQDSLGIISSVGSNPFGRDVWFSFVKKNWKTFLSRYGDGGYSLSRMLKAISSSPEAKHQKQFADFFKKHPTPGADRAVEQALESMKSNQLWLARDYTQIAKFLKKRYNFDI